VLAAHLGPARRARTIFLPPSLVAHAHALDALAMIAAATIRSWASQSTTVGSSVVAGALTQASSSIARAMILAGAVFGAKLVATVTATIAWVTLAASFNTVAIVGRLVAIVGTQIVEVHATIQAVEARQTGAHTSGEVAHAAAVAVLWTCPPVTRVARESLCTDASAIVAPPTVVAVVERVA